MENYSNYFEDKMLAFRLPSMERKWPNHAFGQPSATLGRSTNINHKFSINSQLILPKI